MAAYAWGRDYHDVIPERLQSLVAFIEQRSAQPVASRCYTDTGPILERDLAQRAGLGWIGKNTCLINPRLGSYFLLAEILLDLDLRAETTHSRRITAAAAHAAFKPAPPSAFCRTGAIDARRCISYLTIELKDAIPL